MEYFTQKSKTLFSILRHPYFGYLKLATKSYLSPSVYYKLYYYAKKAPNGHAIDIGPAQGGTTIAIAKGFIEADKTTYDIHSIEKGHSSNALANESVSDNKQILEQNINRFGVSSSVIVHMAYSHEAFIAGAEPAPLGFICIDADGALDRDFRLFYNHLLDNGFVVLDDYEDMINRHGKKLLQADAQGIEKFINQHNVQTLAEATPLGKELLMFRFVNYCLEAGLLETSEIVGANTWFGYKPVGAPEFSEQHWLDMQNIREEIASEFWKMRSENLA